jgi:competence protein ComEA
MRQRVMLLASCAIVSLAAGGLKLTRFFLILTIAVIAAAQSLPGQSLPEDDAQELVESVCSMCHTTTRLTTKHWTRAEWESTVLEMLQEAPDVTPPERDQIVAYLVKYFGRKINVNKAPAREFEIVLELSAERAAAVVAYRDKTGGFKTLEDLKKSPGLDAAKVDSKKSIIEF